jgi:hypothetical protein
MPAKDFGISKNSYETLGFEERRLGLEFYDAADGRSSGLIPAAYFKVIIHRVT